MKKIHIRLLAVTLFLSSLNLFAPHHASKKVLARLIRQQKHGNICKRQQKLLDQYKIHTNISANLISRSLDILIENNTFPQLKKNIPSIDSALTHFRNTPGFIQTLCTSIAVLNQPDSAKGHLYEIATAVHIQQNNEPDEKIICFNQVLQAPSLGIERQFDIVTNKRLIECKAINWQAYKKSEKLKQQFRDQKQIIDNFNQEHQTTIEYVVFSQQPLPNYWQNWFAKRQITVVEINI